MTKQASATMVACLTPPGTAAIAVIAMQGPQAWIIVRSLYRSCTPLSRPLPEIPQVGHLYLGMLGDALADEIVLAIRAWLPTPCVEMSCHGGREVVRMLMENCCARGAVEVSWQAFIASLSANSRNSAAVPILAQARTKRTASILLDQYNGAMRSAREEILAAFETGCLEKSEDCLGRLAEHISLGRHLVDPWRVVVAGAPNVGKSSLTNALAGYQRSIVAPTPGTTRDVVTTPLSIDGWPVEVVDTAGIRDRTDSLEEQGIALARAEIQSADLVVWVLDGGTAPTWLEDPVPNVLLVINKTDLPGAWEWDVVPEAVHVCAASGQGLPTLCDALSHALVPSPPLPSQAVPYTPRMCDAVAKAWQAWREGERAYSIHLLKQW